MHKVEIFLDKKLNKKIELIERSLLKDNVIYFNYLMLIL